MQDFYKSWIFFLFTFVFLLLMFFHAFPICLCCFPTASVSLRPTRKAPARCKHRRSHGRGGTAGGSARGRIQQDSDGRLPKERFIGRYFSMSMVQKTREYSTYICAFTTIYLYNGCIKSCIMYPKDLTIPPHRPRAARGEDNSDPSESLGASTAPGVGHGEYPRAG